MKKTRKKGFSLIELIVVIAVIAAIAAVIVPSVGNFSNAARISADKKNMSAWNQTYLNLKAGGGDTTWISPDEVPAALADVATGTTVGLLDGSISMGGTTVTFTAPSFQITGGGTLAFSADTGLSATGTGY